MELADELESWEVGIIIENENELAYQQKVYIVDQEFPSLGPNTMKKRFKPKSKPLPVVVNSLHYSQNRFYNGKRIPGENFKPIAQRAHELEKAKIEPNKNPRFGDWEKLDAASMSDAELAASFAAPEKNLHGSKIKFEAGGPKKFTNAKKDGHMQNNSPQKPEE